MIRLLILLLLAAEAVALPLQDLRGLVHLTPANNPYVITRSLVQGPSDSLIIDANVEIQVNGYHKVILRGYVHIAGTPKQPVRIVSSDSGASWIGVHFATGKTPMQIASLELEGAFRNTLSSSTGRLVRCNFRNNFYGLWVEDPTSVQVDSSVFEGNRYALSIDHGDLWMNGSRIENNVFGLLLEKGARLQGPGNLIQENQVKDRLDVADPKQASQEIPIRQSVLRAVESRF